MGLQFHVGVYPTTTKGLQFHLGVYQEFRGKWEYTICTSNHKSQETLLKKSIQTMFYILFFFTVNMKILSVCPPLVFICSGPWSNI